MKFILSFFILFSSLISAAQSWKDLNTEFLKLYNNEEYNKAIIIGEKATLAAKKEFGPANATYATSLYNLAAAYLEIKNYKKAEALYIETKKIQQKVLGENHPDYASTISDLATLYVETKQYANAEPLYLQAKKISETSGDISNAEYFTIIDNLAVLYNEMSLYEKAEPLYLQLVDFYKKEPGENNEDYETTLSSLATLYDHTQKYKDAETYYWLLAEEYKKRIGDITNEYARTINKIALIYSATSEYEKAETLYFQNAYIRKTLNGDNDPDYATALNNIASHYIDLGQYEKAMSYYLQAIDIAGKNTDKRNTDYLTFVNNMALLYMQMGKYDMAEPLFFQLKETKKKLFGENDPSYATSLNNLAVIYFKTGQYEKAIPVYTGALAVIKKSLGEQTPDYASSLNNLALLYATMGDYNKAEPLYLLCKSIREKIGIINHPDYAALLDNLALLYSNMGTPSKTKPLYIQAKNIRLKLFGENHPDYAVSLNNLAYYYMDAEQYDSAEVLFLQAKDIMKRTLGEEHPNYGSALNNLSGLYLKSGQYKKVEQEMLLASKIILQNIRNTFTILSEEEKTNYLKNNNAVSETNNSFLFRYKKASPQVVISNFNLQLVLKSASLSDIKNMMELLQNSVDSSIQKLFYTWTANKNLLAKQYSLPAVNRRKDLETIETETETQEKELTRISAEFQDQQNALQITMQDVQKNLQANEAAVEFVRFPLVSAQWTDSVIYAAYILQKNDIAPVFVPLFEEKQLQQLFDSAGKSSVSMVNSFYRGMGIKNKSGIANGAVLYNLIWQPLEKYLTGIKKIAYSPAGKLYSIAFQALRTDSSTMLMDKYELQQYISIRQIALRNAYSQVKKPTSVTLFGNASFTLDSLQLVKQRINKSASEKSVPVNFFLTQKRAGSYGAWNELPGTAEEVNKIKQLFDQAKIDTKTFTLTAASEENLKALNGRSPQILHIATHGFFLPEPKKKNEKNITVGNTYTLSDNPLLRSGLILSGANYAWSGKKPVEGVEDGIVTAFEISQLNLSNTELVVLSACETALGDIKGSEGVFGLQRSFKIAGAKKMIVSLWQVPDKETAELMTTFYSYYINGKLINEAFYQAQGDMRKKYPPYYWAAFVLIE